MGLPFGSSVGQLVLGNLVSRGADRLLNPNQFKKNQFNILTGGGITGEGTGDENDRNRNKGPTTLGGIAKQGIMSLIARSILGPILGPLALTVGQNFLSKRKDQELGIMPFGGPFNFGRPDAPTVAETAGKYGITDVENIKDVALPEDSGSAAGEGSYDYGITQDIDYSDSGAVADAIDSSTPDDFGQSEGMVDGWED